MILKTMSKQMLYDDSYKVVIPAQGYHDFMKKIAKEQCIKIKDKGGRECEVILDKDGFPHRKDIPYMYLQLKCESIMDMSIIMGVFEENGKKVSI